MMRSTMTLLIAVVALLGLVGCSSGPSLSIDKKSVKAGETINVSFKASKDWADNAWVGIIPSNIAHGSEAENDKHDVTYQYLKKRTSGTLVFKAPSKAGSYDFRMHDTDGGGKEVASVSFTVK